MSKVSDKPDPLDQWAAVLVLAVTPLDAGRFTCRVRDRGSEQCRSADVRVLSPPRASVRPLVHAVRAGGNVTTCCYTGAERLGVTWAKNKALLALSPGREVWEDLEYPPGSLLRLYNVQVSRSPASSLLLVASLRSPWRSLLQGRTVHAARLGRVPSFFTRNLLTSCALGKVFIQLAAVSVTGGDPQTERP